MAVSVGYPGTRIFGTALNNNNKVIDKEKKPKEKPKRRPRRRAQPNPRPRPKPRVQPKVQPKPKVQRKEADKPVKFVRMRRRRPQPPQERPASRKTRSEGKRTRDLAVLRRANFSIKKTGNRYTLAAKDVNDSVLEQIKAFLNRKAGKVYIDEENMSKPAALRYISANLRKKSVEVVFRRR